ncbi:hypothetical protein ANCCAN_28084 [Ancylostoma caninum]|uniref:G protein gamma domain-containing protein n=1 Tax=Ancylostoma caninum TaxID=29170 RepID=A0A368F276_ANCCA|nr:hypothetical protein ANCCAN_28084 [Ancylostoma caninum]
MEHLLYRMSSREQAVQQARKTVEQLRGERNMRRTPVSASAADLISAVVFCGCGTEEKWSFHYKELQLLRPVKKKRTEEPREGRKT